MCNEVYWMIADSDSVGTCNMQSAAEREGQRGQFAQGLRGPHELRRNFFYSLFR